MNSMDRCCNNRNGKCYLTDKVGSTSFVKECPFSKQAQQHCELYAPASFCKGASKVSSIEKHAAWADVAAKARAIVATGGVNIIEENTSEIEAMVTSYQVAPEFPVYMGGPYDVILSKRSWTNQENVGGWIQGYLCSCEWGYYNGGEPGPRWQGRFCAHAYATLLVANARARNEFTRNRMASMFVMGECCECGSYKDVSVTTGMCQACQDDALFDAVVAAYQDKATEKQATLIQAVAEEEFDEISDEMEVTPIDEKTSMLTWGDHKAVVSTAKPIDAVDCHETHEALTEEEQWELDSEMWEMEGSNRTAYDYASYDESSIWSCDEIGEQSFEDMKRMYEETVDKTEYPDFDSWEWDMVRSGWATRVAYEESPWTQKIKTDAGEVYLEQVGDKWCIYPSEEFAENYDMDPDPVTGGPFEEFSASDPDEASVLAQSILEEDWALTVEASVKVAAKPPSKDDFESDFWGSMEQMTCTKGKYKYDLDHGNKGWGWVIRNKSDESIVQESGFGNDYDNWEEAYDAMVQQAQVFAKRTASDSYIVVDGTPFGYWEDIDGYGRWDVLFTVHTEDYDGKAQQFLNSRLPQVNKTFDSIVDANAWVEQCVSALREYREASRTAMVKDATRHFTYAEMQELEDEIIGTELHNTDRFKD